MRECNAEMRESRERLDTFHEQAHRGNYQFKSRISEKAFKKP